MLDIIKYLVLFESLAAIVSITLSVGLFRPSVDIIIDRIELYLKIFIYLVWSLKMNASGFRFMLFSVHPFWGELWTFPDKTVVIVYSVFFRSLGSNVHVIFSDCESFSSELDFVDFDFRTALSYNFNFQWHVW